MVNLPRASLCLLASLVLAGCGDNDKPASALNAPTFGNATVTGRVTFDGPAPDRRVIDMGQTCGDGPTVVQEETIVVKLANGGLRDVIVYLKDAPASSGAGQPVARLDQNGCQYKPHVLALQQGQRLLVSSSDHVFHNAHWTSETNPSGNLGFTPLSAMQAVTFQHPDFVKFRCDVHPWMEAWVGVLPNPFAAVTDADGHFEIPKVPAGHYTLAAWHPLLGERTQAITVAADGSVTADFTYAKPTGTK